MALSRSNLTSNKASRYDTCYTTVDSFTCHQTRAIPLAYFPAAEHHCLLASSLRQPRDGQAELTWVDRGKFLASEIGHRVTHPSTNRVQRRATSLI